jgi:phosphoglycerate dehydrogenase-like enzyme
MTKQVVTFGLDTNMRALIDRSIDVHKHCDAPLHEAPKDIVDETDIAIIFVFSDVNPDVCHRVDCDAIISLGAGIDHINVTACNQNDIIVCNTPHYGSRTVAEHTFALLLCFERHLTKIENQQLGFDRSPYLSQQLAGKTFGAIGTGGIGEAAVNIAQGFNMNTIGYDVDTSQTLEEDESFTYKPKRKVFSESDYVGLYVPAVPGTENTVDVKAVESMNDNALLINTARAAVVDHEALYEALTSDEIRGALLDVVDADYEQRFFDHEKAMVTPHHAFYTEQALENMTKQAKSSIQDIRKGKVPANAL